MDVDLQVDEGKTFRFSLAPDLLRQLLEHGNALARLLGVDWRKDFAPLVVESSTVANGHSAGGHTKRLQSIEYVGGYRSPARAVEQAQLSALDDVADDIQAQGGANHPAAAGADDLTVLAEHNRSVDQAAFDEAWRRYANGDATLGEAGVMLELTPFGARSRFIQHKGADYHRVAKLWQRHHHRPRLERMRLFAQSATPPAP